MRSATSLPSESSTSGLDDVLDDLEREHRMVDALFARAALVDGDQRAAVVDDLVRALSVHAVVEEEVVYPAIARTLVDGEVLAERSRQEHQEVKELLASLDEVDAATPEALDLVRRLAAVVQAHVAVEEAQMWPAFRASAAPRDLTDLRGAAAAAREGAPTAAPVRNPPPAATGHRASEEHR